MFASIMEWWTRFPFTALDAPAAAGYHSCQPFLEAAILDNITLDDFRPHVGESFVVQDPACELKLTSVRALAEQATGGRVPFSLDFTSPLTAALPQGIYRLQHEKLGVLDIFIVPRGPADGLMQYEAIFT